MLYNEYFEYLKKEISNSKIQESFKERFFDSISFIKVCGHIDQYNFIEYNEISNIDYQLYLLFELISTKIFHIKTYPNWKLSKNFL